MVPEHHKLEKIAVKIETEITSIKKKIYVIGKLLTQAKEILDHGQFTKWVEERFKGDLPYSTAWLYSSIYEKLEYYPELMARWPLHILMDVRKLPIEILKLIKNNPGKFEENRKEVMELYRSFKRREIELDDFVEQYKEMMAGDSFIPDERADERVEQNRITYKRHLIEQLKNQFGTMLKTIHNLEKVLAEDEQTEVSQALSLDIDQTIMGMVRIKELLAKNDLLVNALSQYRSLPCSPEKITTNRRCRLSLPASKL